MGHHQNIIDEVNLIMTIGTRNSRVDHRRLPIRLRISHRTETNRRPSIVSNLLMVHPSSSHIQIKDRLADMRTLRLHFHQAPWRHLLWHLSSG